MASLADILREGGSRDDERRSAGEIFAAVAGAIGEHGVVPAAKRILNAAAAEVIGVIFMMDKGIDVTPVVRPCSADEIGVVVMRRIWIAATFEHDVAVEFEM